MVDVPGGRSGGLSVVLLAIGIAFLLTLSFSFVRTAPGAPHIAGVVAAGAQPTVAGVRASDGSAGLPSVQLSMSPNPGSICAYGGVSCPNGTSVAQVNISASVSKATIWSSVQLAFVLDTTPYMGVYDPYSGTSGGDPCADAGSGGHPLCSESNGVPFLIHNMSQITRSIQGAHPGTNVSFALVDYFATLTQDDGDGSEFHVDVGNFSSNVTQFSSAVNTSFAQVAPNYTIADSDVSDNSLHSSSITSLYGTMVTGTLNWSSSTHHVIVWVGLTAPRDLNYSQNLCVAGWGGGPCSPSTNMTDTCEPSYAFVTGASPNCLGWVSSQTGNASQSLAALAHQSSNCNGSLGGKCTIDTIDVWGKPTDPYSKGWPTGPSGGGPGGKIVTQNVNRVLTAGCDLANATNGSWDGPSFFTCPSGTNGTIHFEGKLLANGSANFNNPTLLAALTNVSFGAVTVLHGVPGRPMFTFVPYGNISLAPILSPTVSCLTAVGPFPDCQIAPTVHSEGGHSYLAWNWSSVGSENILHPGDRWSASFSIVASGGPYGDVPIGWCSTSACGAAEVGSSSVTSGFLIRGPLGPSSFESFPLATIAVSGPPRLSAGFSAMPVAPLVNESTFFLANVGGGALPYDFNWSFGDGATSTLLAPQHAFAHPGIYTVSLRVGDRSGQTSQASFALPVGTIALDTTLTVDQAVTTIGRAVQFAGSASGGYSVLSYAWSGLPQGCSSQNTSTLDCVPGAAGTFSVSLLVSDVVGDHRTSSVALRVNPPVQTSIASTSSSVCSAAAVASMTFTANVTGGTPTYEIFWSFGDGATGSGSFPISHTYLHPGSYEVKLAVTDSAGATSNGSVVVHPAAPASCPSSSAGARSLMGSTSEMLVIALAVIGAGAVAIILIARRSR